MGRCWLAHLVLYVGNPAQSTETLQKLSVLQFLLLIDRHLTPHTLKLGIKRKHTHNNHPHGGSNTLMRVSHMYVNWFYR